MAHQQGIYVLDLTRLTSDGDASKRPDPNTTTPHVAASPPQLLKFLQDLAKEMEKRTPIVVGTPGLPRHYYLTMVQRGVARGKRTHDPWLWGHPTGKPFKSIKQFAIHVGWMMGRDSEIDEEEEVDEYDEVDKACECSLCNP